MNRKVFLFSYVILAFVFSSPTGAEEINAHKAVSQTKPQVTLSPDLKNILIEEMMAIQEGMMALVPAIASADWPKAEEIGEKLHDSYIMKQRLTEAQIAELHDSLPPAFIEMDHSFHHTAKMLSHAAGKGDSEIVNFYFYKLNESCVKCHAKFATERFPAFSRHMEHKKHHH